MKKYLVIFTLFFSVQMFSMPGLLWNMLVTNGEATIELIKRLVAPSEKSVYHYDSEKGIVPDYPHGSYLPFNNPTFKRIFKKIIDGQEYTIYIISGDKDYADCPGVIYPGKPIVLPSQKPYTIVLTDEKQKRLARFRFYINEKNKAEIYTTGYIGVESSRELHKILLEEIEIFLKKKNVISVINNTARMETDEFFTECGYCDKDVYQQSHVCQTIDKKLN